MNRNQSNESTKRNHGLGARSPRSVTSTTRANAPSRRALRERPNDRTTEPMEPSERAFAREIYPYQNPRFTTRQSRLTSRGSVFPSPDPRAGSIEIKDVLYRSNRTMSSDRSGISPDRSIDRSIVASSFVRFPARFPREVASESTDSIDVRETSRGRRRDEVRCSFVRLIFFVFFVFHPRVRPSVAPRSVAPRVRARTGTI